MADRKKPKELAESDADDRADDVVTPGEAEENSAKTDTPDDQDAGVEAPEPAEEDLPEDILLEEIAAEPELELEADTNAPAEAAQEPLAAIDTAATSKTSIADHKPARGGFVPLFLGGVAAAALGFVVARTEVLDPVLPAGLRSADNSETIAALQATAQAQATALAALRDQVAGIQIPDLAPVNAEISTLAAALTPMQDATDALSGKIDAVSGQIGPWDARLTAIEKAPIDNSVSDQAIAAYERELAALQASVAEQRAEVEAMLSNARAVEEAARASEASAASASQKAANRATMAQLTAALDTGNPYADSVAALTSAGVDVPQGLAASATTGVVPLIALAETFPVAARAALASARSDSETRDRGLSAFLTRQLGARSVAPKEGSDPDAVLSRAEAAVLAGQLADALAELNTLPAPARAEMAGWIAEAETRLAAVAAAGTLTDSLNTN